MARATILARPLHPGLRAASDPGKRVPARIRQAAHGRASGLSANQLAPDLPDIPAGDASFQIGMKALRLHRAAARTVPLDGVRTMDFEELVQTRRSVRGFKKQSVPRE